MTGKNGGSVKKHSLSNKIADDIRLAIINKTLKFNDRLPSEDQLAKQYQVSRPTVREALQQLAAQNLIRTRRGPRGGSFINKPSLDELSDAFTASTRLLINLESIGLDEIQQLRRELDQIVCKLATNHRKADNIDSIRQILIRQAEPSLSADLFSQSDMQFHRAIVDATGNRVLSFIMTSIYASQQQVFETMAENTADREIFLDYNRSLLEAIINQDAGFGVNIVCKKIDLCYSLYEKHLINSANTQKSADTAPEIS